MNIPPAVWGPFFWLTIHIIAIGYPNNPSYTDKKAAKEFYESLANLIPCPVCRDHYKQHLQTYPLTPNLDSRSDLFRWSVDLHNAVNKMLNKPTWTQDEVLNYLKRLGERGKSPIVTADFFIENDMKMLLTGGLTGAAIVGSIFGWLWWASKKHQ
jgi:hypothetical protein